MSTVKTFIGNIKGPKGDTGATGATGPQGPQGEYAAVDSTLSKTSTNPIQNKAVAEELENKLNSDGDSKDLTTTFTSQDSTNVTQWTDVGVLQSSEKHSSLFQKVATMFKNIRYLYHMLGTADISTLGEGADIGTVTGALSKLNSDKSGIIHRYLTTESEYISGNDYNVGILDFASYNKIISFQVITGFGYVTCEDGINLVFHCLKDCVKIRLSITFSNDMTGV